MKRILLAIAMIAVLSNTFAQRHCGSQVNLFEIQQSDPARYERIMDMERQVQQSVGSRNVPSGTIIIPVVVHIVYNNNAQNISDAQINAQIQVLNEDFRRLNADRTNTPSAFLGVAGDANIEFKLAKIDPNGNSTTGITRTSTSVTGFSSSTNNVKFTSSGGRDAWNTQRYLNIWVCNLTPTGLMGYAQFPDEFIISPNTDGVVIDYEYFGVGGHTPTRFNKGRTTTHEVGHWLNLRHIWGDANNCNATDFVDDTPNQQSATDGCRSFPAHDQCTPTGNGIMFMNFMDYSDDACMNVFTNGQIVRMRALFNTQTGIRREMLLHADLLTNPPFLTGGPANFCGSISSGTFSVTNAQGYIVEWETSSHFSNPPPGQSATITRNTLPAGSAYSGYVKAHVKTSQGALITTLTQTVSVGSAPDASKISSHFNNAYRNYGGTCDFSDLLRYNGYGILANNNTYGITSVYWYSDNLASPMGNPPYWDTYLYGSTQIIHISSSCGNGGTATVGVDVTNPCGTTPKILTYLCDVPCPPGDNECCKGCICTRSSPNPVDDELTINFIQLPARRGAETYTVRLIDGSGNVQRETRFEHQPGTGRANPVKFNVSNLREGTYFLHAEGAGEIRKEQIIVKRK